MTIELDLQIASDVVDIPQEDIFLQWVNDIFQYIRSNEKQLQLPENVELSIRIVDIEEITELNSTYRKKESATNVLSFPFEAGCICCDIELEFELLGDIVICAPVIGQEAKDQGKDIQAHWLHMIVHGILHLLGFDHINDTEAEEMECIECNIITNMGFTNPYK